MTLFRVGHRGREQFGEGKSAETLMQVTPGSRCPRNGNGEPAVFRYRQMTTSYGRHLSRGGRVNARSRSIHAVRRRPRRARTRLRQDLCRRARQPSRPRRLRLPHRPHYRRCAGHRVPLGPPGADWWRPSHSMRKRADSFPARPRYQDPYSFLSVCFLFARRHSSFRAMVCGALSLPTVREEVATRCFASLLEVMRMCIPNS